LSALGRFPAAAAWLGGAHIARVTKVDEAPSPGQVQVQLMGPDPDGAAKLWARVAVPYAGSDFGAFFIPDVETEVLVLFHAGDPAHPVVIGALWNGAASVPETIGGDRVDRWTLTGRNGTRIAIVEESEGEEKVEITTPGGAAATITDSSGGEVKLEVAGNTITMGTSGVSVEASSECSVTASRVSVSAGSVQVDAGMSRFSGVVQCDTLITNSVVSSSYTPGAGNVW
jgi:uncharacterized protein involved in type VI secretion and phage assembly